MIDFGKNLRRCMKEAGIGTDALAKKCYLNPNTISAYRWNRVSPTIGMLDILAPALGCSVYDLVRDEKEVCDGHQLCGEFEERNGEKKHDGW